MYLCWKQLKGRSQAWFLEQREWWRWRVWSGCACVYTSFKKCKVFWCGVVFHLRNLELGCIVSQWGSSPRDWNEEEFLLSVCWSLESAISRDPWKLMLWIYIQGWDFLESVLLSIGRDMELRLNANMILLNDRAGPRGHITYFCSHVFSSIRNRLEIMQTTNIHRNL